MKLDVVIKGAKVFTSQEEFIADIGIKGEKIVALGSSLTGEEVVYANDKYVFPGILDVHTHFQLPMAGTVSCQDFRNGTLAAAFGGVTTIIDFSTQQKGETLLASFNSRLEEMKGNCCIDYSLHIGITDWKEKTKQEMADFVARGLPSFKMFMIYRSRGLQSDDAALFEALEEAKKLGAIISVHAENDSLLELFIKRYQPLSKKYGAYAHALSRPDFIEEEAVLRAIKWAEVTGGDLYLVHLSSGKSALAVKEARNRGVKVYGETCPQYLLLDDSLFLKPFGHLYASCPQIKKKKDNEILWQALSKGELQVVATDTCTFNKAQKDLWGGDFTKIPYGLPGVETLLPLIYTYGVGEKRITTHQLISLLSTNPAKIFGLYPRKGTIQINSDADLVIFNPAQKINLSYKNLKTNCDWSPYEGFQIMGYPESVICRGKFVIRDNNFVGDFNWGNLLLRSPYATL